MLLKNKINIISVSIILLSALLYNIAFYFPDYFGFGALLALGLVGFVVCLDGNSHCILKQYSKEICHPELVSGSLNKISSKYIFMDFINPWILNQVQDDKLYYKTNFVKQCFCYGLLWGALVFSGHFVWLLVLLIDKIKASLSFAIFAYIFFVCYFSLTSAIWFGIIGRINRLLSTRLANFSCFLLSCIAYFYLLENYALWFFGRAEGYPFLNPLIPLAGFKPLAMALGFTCCLAPNTIKNIEFIYLKPEIISGEPDFIKYEYQIYKKLLELKLLESAEKQVSGAHEPIKEFVILAPESTFPFPINKYPSAVELWSKALPPRAHMLLGTQIRLGGNMCAGKLCQSVCWLTQCRIKKFYVKRHCVPFVEKIPKFYHKVEAIRKIFLGDAVQFSRAKKLKQDNYFELNDKTVFIPQICSELFFTSSFKMFSDIAKEYGGDKQAFIVLFINDSWFTGYFKNILQSCVKLKSLLSGVPLIYVGHEALDVLG